MNPFNILTYRSEAITSLGEIARIGDILLTSHAVPWIAGTSDKIASVPDSLHILQQHLLSTAVIKLCRTTVGMAGDSLGSFQGAVIFQKIRDLVLTARP